MNVRNATELYVLRWLRWQILCCMYLTTVKKKKGSSEIPFVANIQVETEEAFPGDDVRGTPQGDEGWTR